MLARKKIILVHPMSNGDCLYATAIARQIKQDFPGCYLTWAIATSCKAIIDNNPYVDEVMEIKGITKENNTSIIRKLKKEIYEQKRQGKYDEVFFTYLIDENLANYDGSIRFSTFRGYGRPITVPVTPVLRLRDEEIKKAEFFADKHALKTYKNVVLFEFAPQSGQLAITSAQAMEIAEHIVCNDSTAIIMSSNIKISSNNKKIIDGSELTLRETAAATHYCTLLLGCSSGITWISTADAAKSLPMVQMLDPDAYWVNPISRDFERQGISTMNLIELYNADMQKVDTCVQKVLTEGMESARKEYYEPLPLRFHTTRRTIYNMLCFLQFAGIAKHIRINIGIYGPHPLLIKEIFMGFATAPFKLIANRIKKLA